MTNAPSSPRTDARLALPPAAEGEYRWGESGEVINLYVENGELRGYMTRRSERSHADSAPMTFAFTEARTAGSALSFRTRHIHGDWYGFQGKVVRAPAANRHEQGEYLLQGTLSTHLGPTGPGDETGGDQQLTRRVSFRQSAGSRTGR